MRANMSVIFASVVVAAALPVSRASAQHADDIWVGRSGDATRIRLGGFDPARVVVLPPTEQILKGWADNKPGFDHVMNAVPAGDLYPLQPGAAIWFEIVKADAAVRAIDAAFHILDDPGESTYLGDQGLHTHLIFHINRLDPGYRPEQWVWKLTFKLTDSGATGYQETAPVTLLLSNVEGCRTGDLNNDGSVNGYDISGFVNLLTGGGDRREQCSGDVNHDGSVNGGDIQPFIDLLLKP